METRPMDMEDIQQFGIFHVLDLTSNHPEFDDHDRLIAIACECPDGTIIDICLQWQREGIIFTRSISLPKNVRPFEPTLENIRAFGEAVGFASDVLADRFREPSVSPVDPDTTTAPKPKGKKKAKA